MGTTDGGENTTDNANTDNASSGNGGGNGGGNATEASGGGSAPEASGGGNDAPSQNSSGGDSAPASAESNSGSENAAPAAEEPATAADTSTPNESEPVAAETPAAEAPATETESAAPADETVTEAPAETESEPVVTDPPVVEAEAAATPASDAAPAQSDTPVTPPAETDVVVTSVDGNLYTSDGTDIRDASGNIVTDPAIIDLVNANIAADVYEVEGGVTDLDNNPDTETVIDTTVTNNPDGGYTVNVDIETTTTTVTVGPQTPMPDDVTIGADNQVFQNGQPVGTYNPETGEISVTSAIYDASGNLVADTDQTITNVQVTNETVYTGPSLDLPVDIDGSQVYQNGVLVGTYDPATGVITATADITAPDGTVLVPASGTVGNVAVSTGEQQTLPFTINGSQVLDSDGNVVGVFQNGEITLTADVGGLTAGTVFTDVQVNTTTTPGVTPEISVTSDGQNLGQFGTVSQTVDENGNIVLTYGQATWENWQQLGVGEGTNDGSFQEEVVNIDANVQTNITQFFLSHADAGTLGTVYFSNTGDSYSGEQLQAMSESEVASLGLNGFTFYVDSSGNTHVFTTQDGTNVNDVAAQIEASLGNPEALSAILATADGTLKTDPMYSGSIVITDDAKNSLTGAGIIPQEWLQNVDQIWYDNENEGSRCSTEGYTIKGLQITGVGEASESTTEVTGSELDVDGTLGENEQDITGQVVTIEVTVEQNGIEYTVPVTVPANTPPEELPGKIQDQVEAQLSPRYQHYQDRFGGRVNDGGGRGADITHIQEAFMGLEFMGVTNPVTKEPYYTRELVEQFRIDHPGERVYADINVNRVNIDGTTFDLLRAKAGVDPALSDTEALATLVQKGYVLAPATPDSIGDLRLNAMNADVQAVLVQQAEQNRTIFDGMSVTASNPPTVDELKAAGLLVDNGNGGYSLLSAPGGSVVTMFTGNDPAAQLASYYETTVVNTVATPVQSLVADMPTPGNFYLNAEASFFHDGAGKLRTDVVDQFKGTLSGNQYNGGIMVENASFTVDPVTGKVVNAANVAENRAIIEEINTYIGKTTGDVPPKYAYTTDPVEVGATPPALDYGASNVSVNYTSEAQLQLYNQDHTAAPEAALLDVAVDREQYQHVQDEATDIQQTMEAQTVIETKVTEAMAENATLAELTKDLSLAEIKDMLGMDG
ncbi:MAG: hypothetical protein IT567_06680, partial [Alphaproteobacteria bacterium]|nr:hypothetical protein [Alphaproteobacteria bacterium]